MYSKYFCYSDPTKIPSQDRFRDARVVIYNRVPKTGMKNRINQPKYTMSINVTGISLIGSVSFAHISRYLGKKNKFEVAHLTDGPK